MSYEENRLKVCVVYFTIFKIRKYVKYYLRLPCIGVLRGGGQGGLAPPPKIG